MTEKEYNEKVEECEKNYHKELRKVQIQYAESNRKYKEGDYIEDQTGVIEVHKIKYSGHSLWGKPECVYSGPRVKKSNLQPFKNGEYGNVWQSNIIKQYHKELDNNNKTT